MANKGPGFNISKSNFRAYTVTDQWRYHEKYQKPTFPKTNKFTLALILRLYKTHIIMSGLLETLRVLFLLLTPQVLKRLLSVLQNLQVRKSKDNYINGNLN